MLNKSEKYILKIYTTHLIYKLYLIDPSYYLMSFKPDKLMLALIVMIFCWQLILKILMYQKTFSFTFLL